MRARLLTSATLLTTATLMLATAGPSLAFGTYNSPTIMGQQAEHERITRSLAEVGIEPATLDLLAGKKGELGGVGAPDFLDNTKGLGPAKKHCDNGDFLELDGYPQTRGQADAAMRECFTYFEQLLDHAVSKAGGLVSENGKVNVKEARADFGVCSFPFDPGANAGSAKCAVLNHIGRALHIAEDFWSHTNWADSPDPSQPISIKNPPGLGRTDIPDLVRYPGSSKAEIPDGLISGCDDSVPVLGPLECRGRVSHSVLAKDNGVIDPQNCESARPTSKYARASVTGESGSANFVLAVCGGMRQAQQTWNDFEAAVLDTYGDKRGRMIVDIVASDTVPNSDVPDGETTTTTSKVSATPAAGATTSTEPVTTDAASESAVAAAAQDEPTDEGDETERQAAAAGDIDSLPAANSGSAPTLLWIAIAMGVAGIVWFVFIARRPRGQ